MTKEFISYEQALALKELGYTDVCFAYWNDEAIVIIKSLMFNHYNQSTDIAAPFYQQSFRWFREKYNLQHEILRSGTKMWLLTIKEIDKVTKHEVFNGRVYNLEEDNWIEPVDYEEAELLCLKKLIEIVKDDKQ
jgi:hypothetical protein